jgi:hypothetical protein
MELNGRLKPFPKYFYRRKEGIVNIILSEKEYLMVN